MIVVDTNIIVALWLPTSASELAERVLAHDPEWAAPLLWRSELRSVLTGYLRRGVNDLVRATGVAEDAEEHLCGREYHVPSAQVLRWAARSNCSAYDCEFVAFAADLGTPLVTSDRAVLRAFPRIALRPDRFVATRRRR